MRRAVQRPVVEFIYPRRPPELLEAWWFRWEFLRRNPDYRSDYSAFSKRFSFWFQDRCFWFEEATRIKTWTRNDENYFYKRIFPVIAKLCHKWQIGNLFSPDWKFNRKNGRRKFRRATMFLPTAIAPELNWNLSYMRSLMDWGFTGTGDSARRYSNHLVIEFDLNWPLKDLLQYAAYVLRRARGNYAWELGRLNIETKNTRRRFEDYQRHLKVWDLAQQGKSAAEIADFLFPREIPYSSQQKVRDHLRRAKKLVSGGYQDIR